MKHLILIFVISAMSLYCIGDCRAQSPNFNDDLTIDIKPTKPNGGVAHYWIASGFDEYTYDNVTYTLNKVLNPSHPFPNEYTETGREAVVDYMLYLNWGCDGISNGWFHSGCFDMSQRVDNHFEDSIVVGGTTPEYNYNFTNITFFSQLDPTITVQ